MPDLLASAPALIVAAAATALVALGMMMIALHRNSRLTIVRSGASVLAGLAVVAIAVVGVVAVSPTSAQANPGSDTSVSPSDDAPHDGDMITDYQLPTLSLDD